MFFHFFFFHSEASLDTDNNVINNADNAEITSILFKPVSTSNTEFAIFPATNGDKNDTPKLPKTLIKYLFTKINKKRNEKKVYLVLLG